MIYRWTSNLRNLILCSIDGDGGGGSGGGGGGEDATGVTHENWHQHLGGEGLSDNASVLKYKATAPTDLVRVPRTLVQGLVNAQALLGRDKIPIPNTPEEFMATFDKLGRPADAKDYELLIPDDLPDEHKAVLNEAQTWFRDIAHKAGLLKGQAKDVFAKYSEQIIGHMKNLAEAAEQKTVAAENALRSEWGSAYDPNINLINRFIKHYGGEELATELKTTGMARSPLLLKALSKAAKDTNESAGFDQSGTAVQTPAQLREAAKTLMADPAYLNASDPRHKMVVAQVTTLFNNIHAGK